MFFIFQSICVNLTYAQQCSCTEFIYLNETTTGGSVHKYSIDTATGALTEVPGVNGIPWYPGAGGMSELPSPQA